MSDATDAYSQKVARQRHKRNKKKIQYQRTVNSSFVSDTDLMDAEMTDIEYHLSDDEPKIIVDQCEEEDYFEDHYLPDEHDNVRIGDDSTFESDDTPPLYRQSIITTGEAVRKLMTFCIKSNFDKQKVVTMMRLIKSILPTPNKLPTTFKQILKIFGKTPSFVTKFYCNNCLTLTTKHNSQHYCSNSACTLSESQLSKRQLTEIVTMNIRQKLQSIIRRNFSFFSGHEELFPAFDIPSGIRYQSTTKRTTHPITLNIHADGAPLIRSTKSALWPCFGSIVELPPPVREYQSNILTLGLWVSCIKPDVNLFLENIIEQLIELSENGTTIFVNDYEFKINVNTQMFVSDLPAKSLFMKTINFNGYYTCTNCITEGTLYNKQIIYPYEKNNYQIRTHEQFVTTAKEVEAKITSGSGRCTSILGIKGLSSLLKVLRYPHDVVYDYMHLICLNHVPTLVRHFTEVLSKNDLEKIDTILSNIRLPHDVNVKYNYSIQSINNWKAKNNRLFILHLALPILAPYLPTLHISHFAIYCLFVTIVHCPKTREEIELSKKLIHYYCETSSKVYGLQIELYSLHAHLHLPVQVLNHGGLAFTSSFCFESAIRHIKNKSHGTKNLGSQIGYWCDIDTIIPCKEFKLPSPLLVNEINLDSHLLNAYRDILVKQLHELQHDITMIKLYLRFKDKFLTYHSFLYSKRYTCMSYLISYNDNHQQIHYGNIILFYALDSVRYLLIQQYHRAEVKISDSLEIPDELKDTIDLFYPICFLSDTYVIIPASRIVNKCVSVPFQQYQCISERRVKCEHD
ncbi:unnamed protein product [Rotaria sp. Silwood1]|nr:unnamed protein product [Rotaria sp. Silwood1]